MDDARGRRVSVVCVTTLAFFLACVDRDPLCLASAVPARPAPSQGCERDSIETGSWIEKSIVVDGVTRSYIVDAPELIKPHAAVPLLVDFHGFGHSAAGVWKVSGFRELGARKQFITVYPDGLPVTLRGSEGAGWEIFAVENNRDLRFVRQLLDELERLYCIDRQRVFATGFSNGAFFTSLLACTMADRFAAVAPVSGGPLTVPCAPGRGVPILIHHGRSDERIEVQKAREARDAWIELNQCREHVSDDCEWHRTCRDDAEVGYCEDDSPHRWPVKATERIWEFFRRHPLATPAGESVHKLR